MSRKELEEELAKLREQYEKEERPLYKRYIGSKIIKILQLLKEKAV